MKFLIQFISLGFIGLAATSVMASSDGYWGFCKDKEAYARFENSQYLDRKPSADWVCQAPTAEQTGDVREANSNRCKSGQRRDCQIGAGGDAGATGDHNVPGGAWYWIPGASDQYPDVKCLCGCFTGDVNILTSEGYVPIGQMASAASAKGGYSVATLTGNGHGLRASSRLNNRDFTVGPEEKEIFQIETDGGSNLTLTEGHPVLVAQDHETKMIQARDLVVGSLLVNDEGGHSKVISVMSWKLTPEQNLVYNLNTKGDTDVEHVIIANGLRVGDVYWQTKLSEQQSRVDNVMKFAHQ